MITKAILQKFSNHKQNSTFSTFSSLELFFNVNSLEKNDILHFGNTTFEVFYNIFCVERDFEVF